MFQTICVILTVLALVFLLLECCARWYLLHVADENLFKKYASLPQLAKRYTPKMTRHRYLGFYPTPNYQSGKNKHNSLGYRGEEFPRGKPEGEFRIVCLGASTTYTEHVEDHRQAYPALVEKRLHELGYGHVRVINAGCMSWTSWETLINFQFRALDLDPDMVIVYHGMNDIHARLVWPSEAYQGDNSGMRAANASLYFPLIERSTLVRSILIKLRRALPHAAMQRNIDTKQPTWLADLFQIQHVRGTYPEGIFNQVDALQILRTNQPVYFRRNIENLVCIAKFRNIKVMLSNFATSNEFTKEARVISDEYSSGFKEMSEVLREIAEEQDVDFYDFAAVFPQDKELFTDGRHLNARGAQLKAQMFADQILQRAGFRRSKAV